MKKKHTNNIIATIENKDAAILAKDHMYLKGDVTNTTSEHIENRNKLLDEIKLDLYWILANHW